MLCSEQVGSVCSWTPRHQTPLDESKQFIAATSGGQREPSRKKEMVAAELLMMMIMTMLKIHVATAGMWTKMLKVSTKTSHKFS